MKMEDLVVQDILEVYNHHSETPRKQFKSKAEGLDKLEALLKARKLALPAALKGVALHKSYEVVKPSGTWKELPGADQSRAERLANAKDKVVCAISGELTGKKRTVVLGDGRVALKTAVRAAMSKG